MEAYFQHPHLNLTNVGFKTKLRIVICEALTRKNQEIFQKAMNLKFNKVFASVSTKNGFVYYRLDQKSRPVKISSLSSLDVFYSTGANENETDKQQNPVHHANITDKQQSPVHHGNDVNMAQIPDATPKSSGDNLVNTTVNNSGATEPVSAL